MYADNEETDIKAEASTSFLIHIKPNATLGETGPDNANMELHLITHKQTSPAGSQATRELHIITSKNLQLDHAQAWILVTPVSAVTRMQLYVGVPQANRLQRYHAS